MEAWAAAIRASGLPVFGATRAGSRPRVLQAAALPAGITGERELVDVSLTTRLPRHAVREALEPNLPPGHALVDLYDVWLGAPSLPATVTAAEYSMVLGTDGPNAQDLAAAAVRLLEAPTLPRQRAKGSDGATYDLRRLVGDVRVRDGGPPIVLGIRTRFDPQLGTGRPSEVLDALAALLGRPIPVQAITRERLVLSGEDDGVFI